MLGTGLDFITGFRLSLHLQLVFAGLFLLVSFLWMIRRSSSSTRPPLPPGPLSVPLFGSVSVLGDILSDGRHELRISLPEKYGKMVFFRVGSSMLIWLNDLDIIKEAFVNKAEVLSDRRFDSQELTDIDHIIGTGKGLGSANYGKEFKERKFLTLQSMKDFGFGGKTLEETASIEASFLIDEFRKEAGEGRPTNIHEKLVHVAVSNVICSVVFGRRFDYQDAEFVKAVKGIRFFFFKRSNLIGRIPFAKYFPHFKEIKKQELFHLKNILDFVENQIQSHKVDFDENSSRDFVDLALKQAAVSGSGKSSIGIENIRKIIMDLFFAGTDTTSATLSWLLLYMIRFPDTQQRCQEELDQILGNDEEVTSAMIQKDFPFTLATLYEVQRVSCIAGASLPHVAREETCVGGYRVPAGCLVFANIAYLHHDPTKWESPRKFNPDRWLNPTDPTKLISNPNFIPFSFGKRKCLGENLAKAEYFIFGISLLKKFRFRAVDEKNPPPIKGQGLVHSPIPFEMLMEIRN